MKISLSWLKDYVSPGISAEELAHRLTMAGLEVERTYAVDGDTVFELEITPNRADCLNMLGVAREVAAILNKKQRNPAVHKIRYPSKRIEITVEDAEDCAQYIGTLIKGISVKNAPHNMRKRIAAVGIRSISNVVDITNFCLMEMGQPLHAFDYDKLAGGKIVVRRARKGEKIITIDEQERVLDPSILVIADAKGPVAIAGIMGGKAAEVTAQTRNILLESAYFNPALIRRASRKLGLSSDSAYRFERGVDVAGVVKGADRATDLILKCARGKIMAYSNVKPNKKKLPKKSITTSIDFINASLGMGLKKERCRRILTALGCKLSMAGGVFKVAPPSSRPDLKDKVDVVEEIARIVGYDHIPSTLPTVRFSNVLPLQDRKKKQGIREMLIGRGFFEIITYSMTNQSELDKTAQSGEGEHIKITNPLTQDQEMMRPGLLPGFLNVLLANVNRGEKNTRFFEVGKVYGLDKEIETLGLLISGEKAGDWRKAKTDGVDFYDMKGFLERVFEQLDIGDAAYTASSKPYFVDGQGADVYVSGKCVGMVGKLNENILGRWSIKESHAVFAEVGLSQLYYQTKKAEFSPVAEYPSIVRDLSIAVKKEVLYQDIKNTVVETGGNHLMSVNFVEEYLGEKIPQGHRGLVFSVCFQSRERTLREEEINEAIERIVEALVKKFNIIRR